MSTSGSSLIHINSTPAVNTLIEAIEDNLGGLVKINNTFYDSRLVQNNYEAYLYYEYFEKSDYPSLGLGIGVKKFDFSYNATLIYGLEFTDNGGDTIPLIYARSRYNIFTESDATALNFEVNAKVFIFGDSDIYDYFLKFEYMILYNSQTNIGLEFGYKETYIDIKGEEIDTVGGNMKTKGVFVGLVGYFR